MRNHLIVAIATLFTVTAPTAHAAPASCACHVGNTTSVKQPAPVKVKQRVNTPVSNNMQHRQVPALTMPTAAPEVPVVPERHVALPDKKNSGVYLGLEGVSRDVNLDRNGQVGYRWSERKHASTNGARLSLGYNINDNVGVELGYMTGFTLHDTYATPSGMASYDATSQVKGGDASVVYHFTDYVPGVYVRGGASLMQVSGASVSRNLAQYRLPADYVYPDKHQRSRRTGVGFVAGIGYETMLNDHIGVNVGYTRYQGIAGDHANNMDMLSVGAKYHF